MPEKVFQIRGQDALQATPALYSNFLAVSRVGQDVQLEFLFLDLGMIAQILEQLKGDETASPEIQGKTVAKLVMPGASLLQVRDHLNNILNIIEASVKAEEEKQNEPNRNRVKSG